MERIVKLKEMHSKVRRKTLVDQGQPGLIRYKMIFCDIEKHVNINYVCKFPNYCQII